MNLDRRVRAVEATLGVDRETPIVVVWDGRDTERFRTRVERARELGHPLRIIRVGVEDDWTDWTPAEEA